MRNNVVLGGPDGPIVGEWQSTSWVVLQHPPGNRAEFFEQWEGNRFYRHPAITLAQAISERILHYPGGRRVAD